HVKVVVPLRGLEPLAPSLRNQGITQPFLLFINSLLKYNQNAFPITQSRPKVRWNRKSISYC
ncbi:MAG: hypothetical protein ABJ311_11500, partial [Erythrobacter sp.]